MNSQHDRYFVIPGREEYEQHFPMYPTTFQPAYSRIHGPPTHFDGTAFWYRPEPPEVMFDHNRLLYNQTLPISSSPLETPMSIKHRRTRSGCFTCRHRRVKCDETRPICERCKKGNRECQFPQPSTSSSSRRADSNEYGQSQEKSHSHDPKYESSKTLPTIDDDCEDEDEDEDERAGSESPVIGTAQFDTETPQQTVIHKGLQEVRESQSRNSRTGRRDTESPVSAATTSPPSRICTPTSVSSTSQVPQQEPARPSRWKHQSPQVQQYLQFHRDRVTQHHYFLKLDLDVFIHDQFIEIALSFEPLLYAVVGFSAYLHTLETSNGRFQDFWKYYCQSIMLLRKWLEAHTDRNEAALLTILQLATFEEYLGDWASVASHHRAAYSIFHTLYTYDNIMATETSRAIFDWLARGDVAVSIMAGAPTILERQWFVAAVEWQELQVAPDDADPVTEISCIIANLRLIGFDMASIHANAMSNPNAMKDFQVITKRLEGLRVNIQAIQNSFPSEKTRTRSDEPRPGSIESYDSRPLFATGRVWPLNFVWIDWYAMEQMHRYQTALFVRAIQARTQSQSRTVRNATISQGPTAQSLPLELEKLSLIQCQIFEAIEKSPQAPSGAMIGCQASLALASVFLSQTPKHMLWARRKLARLERMGYVWAPSFRRRMAQLWDDKSILEWWLPDGEYKIDILDEIRDVVEERNKEIKGRGGDERDDIREMKAVFDKLDFGKGRLRTRKDSVWDVAGNETRNIVVKTSSPSDSEYSDDENSSDEDKPRPTVQSRRGSRDSGVGATPKTLTRRGPMLPPTHRPQQPPPPPPKDQPPPPPPKDQPLQTLEYSNRMSGIWEGPMN